MKTQLNDLFDQMDEEKGNKIDDKIQVEESKAKELISLIFELDNEAINNQDLHFITDYLSYTIPEKYTAKSIEQFTLILADEIIKKTMGEDIGIFINYLIQNSKDQSHTIHANQLTSILFEIGRSNTKNIKVLGNVYGFCGNNCESGEIEIYGNVGGYLGEHMTGGKIIVHGNSTHDAGFKMRGGTIIIKGNADISPGCRMSGGKIIIKKNAEVNLGYRMSGGEIKVNGEIKSISHRIYGGNIYHKNKQIVKNGKILDRSYLPK